MAKVKTSFEHLWNTRLEAKAKALGVLDGDMTRVRSAAKNLMVSAGWTQPDGDCEFVSTADLENCVSAVNGTLEQTAHLVVSERRVVSVTKPGFAPTKAQVTAGMASAPKVLAASAEPVALESTQVAANAFSPTMGKIGDRCPRCSGSMEAVGLVNDKFGLICHRDRVVTPMSFDTPTRS